MAEILLIWRKIYFIIQSIIYFLNSYNKYMRHNNIIKYDGVLLLITSMKI